MVGVMSKWAFQLVKERDKLNGRVSYSFVLGMNWVWLILVLGIGWIAWRVWS
jgi:hypothetical protein